MGKVQVERLLGDASYSDDVVVIRQSEKPGEPSVVTINCPDKTGLGCDLCRIILFFGLSIVRGDMSTDGKWCYIVFWVVGRGATRWELLKKRLLGACPPVAAGIYSYCFGQAAPEPREPQIFLLKFWCDDRLGLLHDVTQVLCDLELTIRKVKVSTTPDEKVVDLFFITDTRFWEFQKLVLEVRSLLLQYIKLLDRHPAYLHEKCMVTLSCRGAEPFNSLFAWELLHTKERKEETYDQLKAVLGESVMHCEIELPSMEILTSLQPSSSFPRAIAEETFMSDSDLPEEPSKESSPTSDALSVTVDNSLSPSHSLLQILGRDHKGLLYDIMRTLKDYKIQLSYGRFYATQFGCCELDLFVRQADGKKIVDPSKQRALCASLRMELFCPLRITVLNRGPDTELLVANPVELSGKGRPLVFYDITLALKMLNTRIFLAEIGRHMIADREWEVYRVLLDDGYRDTATKATIEQGVTKMLMGWQ